MFLMFTLGREDVCPSATTACAGWTYLHGGGELIAPRDWSGRRAVPSASKRRRVVLLACDRGRALHCAAD